MASSETDGGARSAPPVGPVLFAYDGSELAQLAIEDAGRQLAPGREALVVCVWQTGDVGFIPVGEANLNAAQATEVREAAEETAAAGASLAAAAGFRPQSVAVESAPTWKGIIKLAEERGVGLIVMGPHRRTGLVGHLLGSVAAAVVVHARTSVLVVPGRS
jgi:nucleotide-binding universal stress UspA family protein